MTTQEKQQTLYIGVDVHKDTHTAVGVSPFGEKLFECTIGNYEKDFKSLTKAVEEKQGVLSPFFGLEDCSGYGERLSSFLVERYPVVHVHSTLVDRQRKRQTHPEKSDSLDALGVAKVMMQSIDTLPLHTVSEKSAKAKQIKELSHERAFLVEEQTRLKNQLHVLLHRVYNSEYTTYFKDPFSLKALKHWSRVRPSCDAVLLRSLKRKVRRLLELRLELKEIENDMQTLMDDGGYTLHTASGCGVVLAASIIGEVGDVNRFKSPAALAKYAGCAPRQCSSGKTTRWRKTRSGNRRLTTAFHRMALSQISRMGNDKARTYFQKKVSEGKSKSQALVCLRRHMVSVAWMMLKHDTDFDINYGD
jgi:transposase